MRLGLKIEARGSAPSPNFHIVVRTVPCGKGGVRQIGKNEQQVSLPPIEFSDAFIGLLNMFGNLLHFSDQCIGALFVFLEPGNFVAGFVALGLALLVGGNQFAALFIEGLEAIKVQGHVAAFGHVRKDVQVITKIIQVMHGGARFAPSSWKNQNSASEELNKRPVRGVRLAKPVARSQEGPVCISNRTGYYSIGTKKIGLLSFSSCMSVYP